VEKREDLKKVVDSGLLRVYLTNENLEIPIEGTQK
jgi:hypothetical protein